jgi:hypothetical protein
MSGNCFWLRDFPMGPPKMENFVVHRGDEKGAPRMARAFPGLRLWHDVCSACAVSMQGQGMSLGGKTRDRCYKCLSLLPCEGCEVRLRAHTGWCYGDARRILSINKFPKFGFSGWEWFGSRQRQRGNVRVQYPFQWRIPSNRVLRHGARRSSSREWIGRGRRLGTRSTANDLHFRRAWSRAWKFCVFCGRSGTDRTRPH